MAVTTATFATVITRSAGMAGGVAKPLNAGGQAVDAVANTPASSAAVNAGTDHFKLAPGTTVAHVTQADAITGGTMVGYQAGTDSVFLQFNANVISSCVLPTAGPSLFFTAQLSGCSIFVDEDQATGEAIVYHANGMHFSASAAQVKQNWLMEWATTAETYCTNLYNAAHADHLAARPQLVAVGHVHKSGYAALIKAEIARKRAMGRSNVDVLWGTNIVGFRTGTSWDFQYQAWIGMVDYDRPIYAPARWVGSKHVKKTGARIVQVASFCHT